ncbi:hypothetical protein [Actinoplanes sp. NPDC051851]|uniref:hypothetical protein n=1 Tax=Actinoplanes sp. NPDC051851 TaxID=3154753 RepID=UPI003444052A
MLKKVVLFASAGLFAAVATACSAPTAAAPTTATDPVSIAPSPAASADLLALLKECPNEGQKGRIQQTFTQDVTGDGTPETLVARTCEASTSYIPSTVEVFQGTKRIGTLMEEAGPTDLPWFVSLTAAGTEVTVTANGVAEDGTQACPELEITYRYAYADGAFKRTAREATTASDCLPVG